MFPQKSLFLFSGQGPEKPGRCLRNFHFMNDVYQNGHVNFGRRHKSKVRMKGIYGGFTFSSAPTFMVAGNVRQIWNGESALP